MKTVIAGSRDIHCMGHLFRAIKDSGYEITEIVSGGAKGVDTLGEMWGDLKGIPVTQFLPDWGKYGRSAGPMRNAQMAEYCDVAIILWDGRSPGTKNMIDNMNKLNKPHHVHIVDDSDA